MKYKIIDTETGIECETNNLANAKRVMNIKNSVFNIQIGEDYYAYDDGSLEKYNYDGDYIDRSLVENILACKNEDIIKYFIDQSQLYREMWKFSYENGGLNIEKNYNFYCLVYDKKRDKTIIFCNNDFDRNCVNFETEETAKEAIEIFGERFKELQMRYPI